MNKFIYVLSCSVFAFLMIGCQTKTSKEEKINTKVMKNKAQVIQILRSTGRPGMEEVICHLDSTDFYTKNGGGHHTEIGGLVQHSLEVYRIMKTLAWFQHSDSIAIAALFHDMGKVDYGGYHPWRSVKHLNEWGLQMTDKEYIAIFRHHNLEFKYARNPLYRALVVSDAISTGWWKLWHKSPSSEEDSLE